MERREFIKFSGTIAVGTAIAAGCSSISQTEEYEDREIIKPPKISKGDKIGLITPGGFISEEDLQDSIDNLEKLGYRPVYNETILSRKGYLAGDDEIRAADLNSMFEDSEIKGIVCARGGYGCARILPLIDYGKIISNPKILVGYSDVTALHFGIYKKTGLITYHGPVGISTFNDYSVDYFERTLEQINPLILYSSDTPVDEGKKDYFRYVISPGKADGRLVGGNLSIVASMLGTPYDVDFKDKIVYLEEVREEPYRVDRMLTEMILAGKFDNAAGVALGVFSRCDIRNDNPDFKRSFTLKEVLFDRLGNLGIPVIYGLSFGHIEDKYVLPFGLNARLDTENETIELLESSVL